MKTVPFPRDLKIDNFVFLDTETTGLHAYNQVLEVGWAVGYGEPLVAYPNGLPNLIADADPAALFVNKFGARYYSTMDPMKYNWAMWKQLVEDVTGKILVGANIRFDAELLMRTFAFKQELPEAANEFASREPWNYRLLDIEAFAAGVLGFDIIGDGMPGFRSTAGELRERGYEIPNPDHTAVGDVIATRACFLALVDILENS